MTTLLEKFTRRDEYGTLYTLALQIVLYADRPLAELGEGAIECFRIFVERFGEETTWYHTRSMRKVRKFAEKYRDIYPTLCRADDGKGLPYYRAAGGEGLQDYLPPIFDSGAYMQSSWLQVQLPPAWGDDRTALLELVGALAKAFPFRYGTVGLVLCWNDMSVARDVEVPELIGPLLRRHPGFNLATPGELCDQPVPPVNWMTLLGPGLVKKVGGISALRAALAESEGLAVASLGRGALVRAGEAPAIGDRNRRDAVSAYRALGRVLAPHRATREIELDGLDERQSGAWLARFDA